MRIPCQIYNCSFSVNIHMLSSFTNHHPTHLPDAIYYREIGQSCKILVNGNNSSFFLLFVDLHPCYSASESFRNHHLSQTAKITMSSFQSLLSPLTYFQTSKKRTPKLQFESHNIIFSLFNHVLFHIQNFVLLFLFTLWSVFLFASW